MTQHPLQISADIRLGNVIDSDRLRCLKLSREFLAANSEKSLRLEDAAKAACLSSFHYHRLFQSAFGETPRQYLCRLRMARAKHLLVKEKMTVTDVCFAVGYESLGSFSSLFHSMVGVTPSTYQITESRIFHIPKLRRFPAIPHCFTAGLKLAK